jgi:sulfotransferase family protein
VNSVAERAWRGLPDPVRDSVKDVYAAYARATGRLRVLPDYLIIGTQRGGTTSLYKYLVRHPAHAHALTKELRFFDLHYNRGLDWYRSCFPTRAYRRAMSATRGLHLRVGEASPDYVFHPLADRRIARDLPWARFVLLLRNPVDRAFSHYWHQRKRGHEDRTFEEAIDLEPKRLAGERERMEADPGYLSYEYHHHSYLARGRYAEQLERWTALFPRERFLVERSEDFYDDPHSVCQRVLDFLELPRRSLGPYEVFNAFGEGSMDPATRERLVEHFRPHNRRLEDLLRRGMRWDA